MMLPRGMNAAVVCLALSTLVGCATVKTMPVKYSDPDKPSVVDTVEAESNDVRLACVSMVKKMLDNPLLASQEKAPHIIVDADYFRNESSSRLNKNMLTDLLRSELLNAAGGRLIFVGREYEEMVNDERNRKDEGTE